MSLSVWLKQFREEKEKEKAELLASQPDQGRTAQGQGKNEGIPLFCFAASTLPRTRNIIIIIIIISSLLLLSLSCVFFLFVLLHRGDGQTIFLVSRQERHAGCECTRNSEKKNNNKLMMMKSEKKKRYVVKERRES